MLAAAALVFAAAPAPAVTPVQAVADVSTRVCYELASDALALPADNAAQEKALAARGLSTGVDQVGYNGLGQVGTAMLSQAIMGSRVVGDARVVVAIGGRMQGCRTLLVAEPVAPTLAAEAEGALAAAGWRKVPGMGGPTGPLDRRVFLRRDAQKRPYLLNLMLVQQPAPAAAGKLRLFTSVAAVPPTVQLPEGY